MNSISALHRQSFCGLHGEVFPLNLGYTMPKSSTSITGPLSVKARTTVVVHPGTALDRRRMLPSKTVAAIRPRPAGTKITYVASSTPCLVSIHVGVAQQVSLNFKVLQTWSVLKLSTTSHAILGYLTPHCAVSGEYDFARQDGRMNYCLNKAVRFIETYDNSLPLLHLLLHIILHVLLGIVVTIPLLLALPFVLSWGVVDDIVSPGPTFLYRR